MPESDPETKAAAQLEPELRDMKIEEATSQETRGEGGAAIRVKVEDDRQGRAPAPLQLPLKPKSRSTSQTPIKRSPNSPASNEEEREEVVGGDITLKMEPGKAPKLARKASQKVVSRPPPLFLDLPDSTDEAKKTFGVLSECTYGSKLLGTTEHALECDCSEEWGKSGPFTRQNPLFWSTS
jgi:[histone H3]-lysine36 N-trimethyltransferase